MKRNFTRDYSQSADAPISPFSHVFWFLILGLLTTQCNLFRPDSGIGENGKVIRFDNYDIASAVAATDDGGAIIVGRSGHNSYRDSTSYDKTGNILLLKTDAKGRQLWHKTYTFGYEEEATDVKVTNEGGYIVAGNLSIPDAHHPGDIVLVKTDAQGNKKWSQKFSRGFYDVAHAVVQSKNGDYIVAGTTYDEKTSQNRILILDYSPSGSLNWSSIINDMQSGDTLNQYASDIIEEQDGFIITGGTQKSKGSDDSDVLLMKISKSGQYEWSQAYGGTQKDGGVSVVKSNDGYVIGANMTDDQLPDPDHGYISSGSIIKTDFDGNLIWSKNVGGDNLYQLTKSSDNGFLIAGYSYNDSYYDDTYGDAYYVKTDADGNMLTHKKYNYNTYDYGLALTELKNGKVLMVGETWYNDHPGTVFAIYLVLI